ncbi:hypothetical protein EYV94_09485 [Puteibacter caeruleilacunae]|nr:hypothetical protein EYV94_09485 [Puteibacter caeruleilacunae]
MKNIEIKEGKLVFHDHVKWSRNGMIFLLLSTGVMGFTAWNGGEGLYSGKVVLSAISGVLICIYLLRMSFKQEVSFGEIVRIKASYTKLERDFKIRIKLESGRIRMIQMSNQEEVKQFIIEAQQNNLQVETKLKFGGFGEKMRRMDSV